jgi:beta-galactosidase
MLNKEICMCSNLRNKNVKYVLTNTILLMPQKNYILQMRNVRLLMSNAIVLILVTLTASCSLTAEIQEESRFNPKQILDSAREVKSLDGTWEIIFDHGNIGRDADWHLDKVFSAQSAKQNITVPSCWEEIEKDYEGVAFYRRTFNVPAGWEGKVVHIHFDAVNFLSEVWINGNAVGFHEGGFTPFKFRIDKLLKPGEENTLILRVAGPILMQNKSIDGIGKMETPQWRGAIAGGIWQPVKLIATDEMHVKDVFIEPKISDNTATFHMELEHAGVKTNQAQLKVAIRSAKSHRTVARMNKTLNIKPGTKKLSWTLNIPNAKYWSPDDPHLYHVDISITSGGKVSDRWTARFGMREFTIRNKRFILNGKPMYLKATFFEGVYPTKLAYPDSKEMAAREIKLAKEAGFNMIRPWRKPPPQMWLDLCDEIGVLTVGSMAIECMDFPFETARLPVWVENEVRESILRDRNRTCVVQWELFNELKRPVLMQLLHPMSMLARKLDPTRMILDESGGWAQGASMFLPYESEPTKFNDIHSYPGPFVNDEIYTKLLFTGRKTQDEMRQMGLTGELPGKNVIPRLMSFFSELGYGSLPNLVDNNKRFEIIGNPIVPPTVYHRRLADEHIQALKDSGFDTIYPNLKQLCLDEQQIHGAANKRMIEAVRCNPDVKGYCIHALVAGDWIIGAGLLDLWRNPKTYAYEGTKAANQPRIISIRMLPRNIYAEQGTKIEITGVNELAGIKGTLKVEIVSDDGSTVFTKETNVNMVSDIARLFSEKLDTNSLTGAYTLKAKITSGDGSLIAVNEFSFDVFTPEQLAVPDKRIAVLDPSNSLKPFLEKSGIAFEEFSPATDLSLSVFVSRTEAKTLAERKQFDELKKFVKSGGMAVYFQAGGPRVKWGTPGKASNLLPINLRLKRGLGYWMGHPRFVKDHPVFDGLPVDCMMSSIYENIWPQHSLMDVDGETFAGTIGIDWFPDYDLERRHYYGPGDVWWGSDMAITPVGKGQCILSQFRLVDNLGTDPVADKILFNMIKWIDKSR